MTDKSLQFHEFTPRWESASVKKLNSDNSSFPCLTSDLSERPRLKI